MSQLKVHEIIPSSNVDSVEILKFRFLEKLLGGVTYRKDWTAGESYAVKDVVIYNDLVYRANTEHVASGSFESAKWDLIDVSISLSGATPGTYTKVTVNELGRVVSGGSLDSADLPAVPAANITGVVSPENLGIGDATNGNFLRGDGTWASPVAIIGTITETQSAVAGQTLVTLNDFTYVPESNSIAVYLNGVRQEAGADYAESSGTTLTFATALLAGDKITIVRSETYTNLVDPTIRAQLAASDGAGMVGFQQAGTGAVVRTAQDKMREWVSVKDFGAVGDETDETAKIQAALNSGAAIVDGNGITCKINSSITIAANQTLQNIKLIAGTAGMNMVLVNTGSKLLKSKLTGTGTVSIIERGIYPAADGVNDVEIDAEITNLTVGIQAAPLSSIAPERWRVGGYIHDIVGNPGTSEGYGVLLSPANGCTIRTKFKTIQRHSVYLSAGASFNDVDIYVDGCSNIAVQIYSTSAQTECKLNRIRGQFKNLNQNALYQGAAVGIIQKSNHNDVSVSVDGSAGTSSAAIWVEGSSGGPYPSGNNIHDCEITGTYLDSVIKCQNAESTLVQYNRIYANWSVAAIFLNRSGTASVNSGGFVEGNYILGAGSTKHGIANSYEVSFHVGTNDVKNIAGSKFIDYSTAKKRTGRLKSVSGIATTGSIASGSYGDVVITLPEAITSAGRFTSVTNNGGSSGTYTYANQTYVFNTSDTTFTIRQYNGGASSQTFNLCWLVEGD